MTKMTTASENMSEQFLVATLAAMRDGNRKAVLGGLITLFNHLKDDGDLPKIFVTNLLAIE